MNTQPIYRFSSDCLREFSEAVFCHFNVPKEDARVASKVLALSDLRGIDTHGIARLSTYTNMLSSGKINPRAKIKIVRQTASTATIDGDNGLGLVVGPKANQIAMEKAESVGSGWVSVSNTNHFGIAGYYPIQALKRDMIGWAMTNTTRLVTPLWGAERMLGTNPIAIAFPTDEEEDVVIDLSTSAVSFGKLEIAAKNKEKVPSGWIVNSEGLPTVEPMEMIKGGAILPLGSDKDHGAHKGYAMAAMVDILSSVLSGANWGPFAPSFALKQEMPTKRVGKGLGHFFGALQIDGFMDVAEFKRRMDEWVRTFQKTKPALGTDGPIIPGAPEHQCEIERSKTGIPVLESVVNDLKEISRNTRVPLEVPERD